MSILGKLMFWKRKDELTDLGLGKDNLAFGDDFNIPNPGLDQPGLPSQALAPQQGLGQQTYPQTSMAPPQAPQFTPPSAPTSYNNPQEEINSKNIEVISSKLDALRASLDSINQRLANIEAIARGEEDHKRRRYY